MYVPYQQARAFYVIFHASSLQVICTFVPRSIFVFRSTCLASPQQHLHPTSPHLCLYLPNATPIPEYTHRKMCSLKTVSEHELCCLARNSLVAPRPWKKLNRDSGPARRSGRCPKNWCNAEKGNKNMRQKRRTTYAQRTFVIFGERIGIHNIKTADSK